MLDFDGIPCKVTSGSDSLVRLIKSVFSIKFLGFRITGQLSGSLAVGEGILLPPGVHS